MNCMELDELSKQAELAGRRAAGELLDLFRTAFNAMQELGNALTNRQTLAAMTSDPHDEMDVLLQIAKHLEGMGAAHNRILKAINSLDRATFDQAKGMDSLDEIFPEA